MARSPLSIGAAAAAAAAAAAKDAASAVSSDLFTGNSSKTSPTDLPPLSLTSSTWSFNPTQAQQNYR